MNLFIRYVLHVGDAYEQVHAKFEQFMMNVNTRRYLSEYVHDECKY